MKKLTGIVLGLILLAGPAFAKGKLLKIPRTSIPTYEKINIDLERLVVLKGPIDETSTPPVVQGLTNLDLANHKPIFLIVNSPGGSVGDGFEVVAAIQALKSPLTCIIETEAYSMAALIVAYCPKTYIHKFGEVMFHEAQYKVQGSESMIKTRVAATQKYLDQQFGSVAVQLGITLEEFRDKIHNEWWMTAKEAVASGLVDGVVLELQYPYTPPDRGGIFFNLDKVSPNKLQITMTNKEPKFHMGDKVKVTSGFYRDCVSGTVVDYIKGSNTGTYDQYMVENLVCRSGKMQLVVILPEDVLVLE